MAHVAWLELPAVAEAALPDALLALAVFLTSIIGLSRSHEDINENEQ